MEDDQMKVSRVSKLVLFLFATSAWMPVVAHHSRAHIDLNDVRTHSGIVVKFGWSMPHVYLKVNAPNENGEIVEYSIEMNHPPAMTAVGWSKNTFKPGDRITWAGQHAKDKSRNFMRLVWAETEDGTRLGMDDIVVKEIIPSSDFTGLWRRNDAGGEKGHKLRGHYWPPEGWPLNQAGQAMVGNFDPDEHPMVTCGNPGPPKSMILPYPVLITRPDEDTVVMERELMEEKRYIHLNADTAPPPGEPSKMGYSVGRFVGDEFIIETTNFTADKWGTHTGIDSSEQKHLLERFWMSDDGIFLMVEITVTDPVYFTEPVMFTHRWKKLADREVIQVPCSLESATLYLEGGAR
jgi:hypothetical protein